MVKKVIREIPSKIKEIKKESSSKEESTLEKKLHKSEKEQFSDFISSSGSANTPVLESGQIRQRVQNRESTVAPIQRKQEQEMSYTQTYKETPTPTIEGSSNLSAGRALTRQNSPFRTPDQRRRMGEAKGDEAYQTLKPEEKKKEVRKMPWEI